MKRYLTLLFLFVPFIYSIGQENQSSKKKENSSHTDDKLKNTTITKASNSISLDSLWNKLVFKEGGCLTGGQKVKDGKFGNQGCVMSGFRGRPNQWGEFFSHPKSELTPFLINKFSDTTTTRIHTCPCMNARNGELAVYALQNIYKTNWYELKGFTEYASKEGTSCMDIGQTWLWDILEDEEHRGVLKKAWLELRVGE